MRFNTDIIRAYVSAAPLALAFERSMECRVLSRHSFERPILDIGCGEGLFAKILFAERVDTGIDPNRSELERARELDSYDELIECWGDSIPKQGGTYRTILSNSVLEHIDDLELVLCEAHRLLAAGGRFYITVPTDRFEDYNWISQILGALGMEGLRARYHRFFNHYWVHHHTYTPEGWAGLVQRCGFRVVEMHSYAPKRVCLTNDALLPLSLPALVMKKFFNRWSLFPGLRRWLLWPVASLGAVILDGADRCDSGGLVFLAMTKD